MYSCFICIFTEKVHGICFEPVWARTKDEALNITGSKSRSHSIDGVFALSETAVKEVFTESLPPEKDNFLSEHRELILAGIAYEKAKQALVVAEKYLQYQQALMYDTDTEEENTEPMSAPIPRYSLDSKIEKRIRRGKSKSTSFPI